MALKKFPGNILAIFLISIFAFAVYPDAPVKTPAEMIQFPEHKNCAAWYSIKSMIFNPRTAMAGINCQVNAQFEKAAQNYRLIAEAPLSGFNSGEKGRDKYFRKALNEDARPALRFESAGLSQAQWGDALNGRAETLKGNIFIGTKSFPVEFSLKADRTFLRGAFVGKYNDFEMEPHTVGPFGLVAKTENHLEIHFQLDPGIAAGVNLLTQ